MRRLSKVETKAVSLLVKMRPWSLPQLDPDSEIEARRFRAYVIKYMAKWKVDKEVARKIQSKLVEAGVFELLEDGLEYPLLRLTRYGHILGRVAQEWAIDYPDVTPPDFDRFIRDSNILGSAFREAYLDD